MSVILQYDESGITYSDTFETLIVKGMDEPDKLHKVAVLHELLDGGLSEQIRGFQKQITLGFKPPFTAMETRFLAQWFIAARKRIIYGVYISEGVTDDALVSTWFYECEHNRTFDVDFYDEYVYRRWDDGVIVEEIMYLKRQVAIIGTQASPETFTTNVGKLVIDETGESYPAFSDATHVFHVDVQGAKYQERGVGLVKDSVAIVTGNLTFQVALDDSGKDAADGNDYADIAISLQAKP